MDFETEHHRMVAMSEKDYNAFGDVLIAARRERDLAKAELKDSKTTIDNMVRDMCSYEESIRNLKAEIKNLQLGVVDTPTADKPAGPTFGEKLIRTDFNPSGSPAVDKVKHALAEALDTVRDFRGSPALQTRTQSVAVTHIETAAMWAAKAITEER